jgi:DNA repair protein RecO (recombination protein O)
LATSKSRASNRISSEPAFVLHRYPWSESSLVLEVFTRHHGRIALMARGARRPTSNFRPVLLPLQPLRLDYGGDSEVRSLKGAEWVGGHVMPRGEALLSGYYLNELLMRLLARDDPHPALFDLYRQTVHVLATETAPAMTSVLRAFELLLLRDIGLLPALDQQTLTLQPLQPDQAYELSAEGGLRQWLRGQDEVSAASSARGMVMGQAWSDLQSALEGDVPWLDTLRVCAHLTTEARAALQTQLRALLHHHCGVTTLRTRQLMMELQSL